jgi:hypothetical protein
MAIFRVHVDAVTEEGLFVRVLHTTDKQYHYKLHKDFWIGEEKKGLLRWKPEREPNEARRREIEAFIKKHNGTLGVIVEPRYEVERGFKYKLERKRTLDDYCAAFLDSRDIAMRLS